MGQGGTFELINGTAYTWEKTKTSSYQMNAWNFPESIFAGTSVSVYVEWDGDILHHKADDAGEVYYSLAGTSNTFQLQARAPGGKFTLQAYFDGIATANNPQGSTIALGWAHDGVTPFILSGTVGGFSSSNPPSDWMQSSLSTIGHRVLRQVCITGSHDSGMSVITGRTALVEPATVLTQTNDIGTQLALGARYFDVRPVIAAGAFKTGHYSQIGVLGWQGGDGQTIQDIIRQVNEFTATNKELIILNLSHDLNTDVGRNYRPFHQDEWHRLFEVLTGITDLFVAENPSTVDLSLLTLTQFIGGGRAAVVAIVQSTDPNIQFKDYANRGFYKYSQFDVYNVYANTDDVNDMVSDQIDKMRAQRVAPDSPPFLLSWTLTQRAEDVLTGGSIIELSKKAKPALFTKLLPACSRQTYPNILYLDDWISSNITALAVAINDMVRS